MPSLSSRHLPSYLSRHTIPRYRVVQVGGSGDGPGFRGRTYPIFPMMPVAVVDLASKSPPLAPEENNDPQPNQEMREAEEAAAHHVPPQLVTPLHGEGPGHVATAAVAVHPRPPHQTPRAGHDLVPDGGAGVVGAGRVDGGPVGPVGWPCHDLLTGQPSKKYDDNVPKSG